MLNKKEILYKRITIIFFVCFFITGCLIFSDYGISWDENVQRLQIGKLNYNAIKTGDKTALLANFHKYYGPAFEIVLSAAADIFNVTDSHHVFLLRHAISFLAFFADVVCFYLICVKIFKRYSIALLASIMLVLSPRIFADSFYNSKDLAMLSFCVIACYTMFLFIEKQTFLRAIIHALACGFVIDVRIMGILVPLATIFWFVLNKEKKIIPFLSFLVYTVVFVIVFWPVMWSDPIGNFRDAFNQMSNYPVNGSTNLFMGERVPAANLPWYYLPVWIGITTPVCYSILFLIGSFFYLKNTLSNFKNTIPLQPVSFILWAPLFAIVVLNSTLYDGWRHVFFIYPFFIIIAAYGFDQLTQLINNTWILRFIFYSTALSIIFISGIMVKNHPFENVYFNFLAGNNIRQQYDGLDYWGLSYKQGLEYILANDKSEQICIAAANSPGWLNFNSIPANDVKRLNWCYKNIDIADYYLSNFRNHPEDYDFGIPVYRINIEGETIMEVRKLK